MFPNEKSIFDFLGLKYKTPLERQTGPFDFAITIAIAIVSDSESNSNSNSIVKKKNKTLKKKVILIVEPSEEEAHIKNFIKNGISVLEALSESELNQILGLAASKYTNQTPIMTDNQYDIIHDFIESKYPNNMAIHEIGSDVLLSGSKVSLPYHMASMNKIKPDTNALINWKQLFTGPYVLSCKLDGVSGLYSTMDSLPKLYTRGNGTIGQDISHLIPHLRLPNIPNIVIRGEFIISKHVFNTKYANKFANPRNMVAGIINHKNVDNSIKDSVKDLEFVTYEVIEPKLKSSEQIEFLKSINVKSVLTNNLLAKDLTNEKLSETLIDWRQNYMYEIDGVIVTNDKICVRNTKLSNPEHAFAFKMVLSDQIAEAIVVDVIWTPSKDGYLKPRVQIEPIHLGGVKIEYATGFNGSFIRDNNIGIGATIELIRSGDVIPHIKSITIPALEPKMPDVPFKWNVTGVDIMLENVDDDPIVKEKNITGFFKGIEVDGLGSGNVVRIIEKGYDSVSKIIKMEEQDFLKIDGFKEKMATKIYTGIHQKLEEASIITLMTASNIFGRGFSDKKMELILNELPDILVSTKTEKQKIERVTMIKGMAEKTATLFIAKIDDFKEFLKESGLESKLYIKTDCDVPCNQDHPLYQKTIVLTGTRDKQIIEYLKQVGAIQGSSISKNTFMVVAKSADEDTGKAEEARKINIPILSVDQFVKKYITK
jgi:NAD-dependent DNA ligase